MMALDKLGYVKNKDYFFDRPFGGLMNPETGRNLRFDFRITIGGITVFIEFDGEFHFDVACHMIQCQDEELAQAKLDDHKALDRLKDEFCDGKAYPLLRITFKDKLETERLVTEFIALHFPHRVRSIRTFFSPILSPYLPSNWWETSKTGREIMLNCFFCPYFRLPFFLYFLPCFFCPSFVLCKNWNILNFNEYHTYIIVISYTCRHITFKLARVPVLLYYLTGLLTRSTHILTCMYVVCYNSNTLYSY